MTEEYIKEETAKLAKVKGFNNGCAYFWGEYEGYVGLHNVDNYNRMNNEKQFSAPTQALLLKWLREKFCLHVELKPWKSKDDTVTWHSQVFTLTRFNMSFQSFEYVTMFCFGKEYEEALEKGLVAALNLLKDKDNGSNEL